MQAQAEGQTLTDALRAAIARLVECDEDDVEIRISAPGLEDARPARVEVEFEAVEGAPEAVDDEDTSDDTSDDDTTDDDMADDDMADDDATDDQGGDDDSEDDEDDGGPSRVTIEELDEEATAAADVVEELLDILELPGDIQIRVLDDRAEVEIVNMDSGVLIGRRGQTLDALQELVRRGLQARFERRSRVQLDIEGYRAKRLEKYLDKAEESIQHVLDTGESERMEPMDSFERKAVHHLVAEFEGLVSHSEGREPNRRVVIDVEPD